MDGELGQQFSGIILVRSGGHKQGGSVQCKKPLWQRQQLHMMACS
jgi:hypothetical protein